jgi:addiction module HigA family antidote
MAGQSIRRTIAPQHPGAVIADILDDQRVSWREAAKAIGMSANGLHKVLAGKGPVTAETAVRIARYFANDEGAALWLNIQQAYDLWHARAKLKAELAKIVPLEERQAR